MSIIKLSVANPIDGTTTFDKVRFYEADDANGTSAAVVATEDIDLSARSQIDPGATSSIYKSGSTSKYYAATYFNSSSSSETDKTTYIIGSKDRWDTLFETRMDDSANAVWSQSLVAAFKKDALDALFPDLFQQVIDTSLTLDNDEAPSFTYTLPHGIFNVSEVGIGDIDNATSKWQELHADNWRIENSTLHILKLPTSESSAQIRLIASKKFLEVGDVPERYDAMVLYHLRMSANLDLADDFPRFKQWGRLQDGTKVSFENLRVHAREFERKFRDLKNEQRNLLYPGLI